MVRIKHRYIVIEINVVGKPLYAPLSLKSFLLFECIINKIQQLHGDYGVALVKLGFLTKYCNDATRIALLRVRHSSYRILASTLPFVDNINGKPITLNTIYVGATMKQCFKHIIKHQTKRLDECMVMLKTKSEREKFQAAVMNLTITEE